MLQGEVCYELQQGKVCYELQQVYWEGKVILKVTDFESDFTPQLTCRI